MASGSYTFSTTNQYITGKLTWSSVLSTTLENTSAVTVSLYYKKSSKVSVATSGTISGKLFIDGVGYKYSKSATLSCNNTYKLIATKTVEIEHDSDGTKKITLDVTGGIGGTTFTSSSFSEKTVALDTIPRYATPVIGVISAAQTTLTVPWTSDASLGLLNIFVNGSLYETLNNPGTSGTIVVSNLSPNTQYTILLQGSHYASGLLKYSEAKDFTTQSAASIASDVSFIIGEDLNLVFNDYNIKPFYLILEILRDSEQWEQLLTTNVMQTQSYTWKLSNYTDLLYNAIPDKNTTHMRILCVTEVSLDDNVSIAKTGTMSINIERSLPSAPQIVCENQDGQVIHVLNSATYIPIDYYGMAIRMNTASIAQNGADILYYIAKITDPNGKSNTWQFYPTVNRPAIYTLTRFNIPGHYEIEMYAVDSRGNKSISSNSAFTVLPYSRPKATLFSLQRENGFERKTLFDLSFNFSCLKIENTIKNIAFRISYQCWATDEDINNAINGTLTTADFNIKDCGDYFEAFLKTPIEFDLDQKKSYNISMQVVDQLTEISYSQMVGQGIPIMAKMDSGHVSIGMVPDMTTATLLQVGSDIMVTDSDNETINLLHLIKTLFGDTIISEYKQNNNLSSHSHDDKYYTENEMDIVLKDIDDLLKNKSDKLHKHSIREILGYNPVWVKMQLTDDLTNFLDNQNSFAPFFATSTTVGKILLTGKGVADVIPTNKGADSELNNTELNVDNSLLVSVQSVPFSDTRNKAAYVIEIGDNVHEIRVSTNIKYKNEASSSTQIHTYIWRAYSHDGTAETIIDRVAVDSSLIGAGDIETHYTSTIIKVNKGDKLWIGSFKGTAARDIDILYGYGGAQFIVEAIG